MRTLRYMALSAGLLAVLTACRAPSPRLAAPERTPPAPAAHESADGSYDWHVLLIAPFGSVLKDIPAALHEVLLFRDEAHGSAAADAPAADAAVADAECYAADAPAPRFVGHIPDEYLLCFRQDHLSRIQASVRLTTAEAQDVFGAACAAWRKNAAPAASAGVPAAEEESAGACEGRDGAIRFRGRLAQEASLAQEPATESVLSIILDRPSTP
jgi:hypothetical protein